MVKQIHTYKGFSVITDYPKDASLWEAYAFRLWCTQDPHWEFIPHGTKGIRQPGLLLLLHSPKTPRYCSAHIEVFVCLHLKTSHFTALYRWAAPGALPFGLSSALSLEQIPLQRQANA